MKRNEIADKYKWKLEDMVPSDQEWEKLYDRIAASEEKVKSFEGKLSDKKVLLDCLKFNEELNELIEKLFCYARMRRDQDANEQKYVAYTDKAMGLINKMGTAGSYLDSEIASLDDKFLEEVIADPDFSDFDFMLKEIMRSKKHILSDKEEKLLSMSYGATGNYSEIFSMINNVEVPFPTVKTKDGDVKLTHGTYAVLAQGKDREVRKAAFDGLYSAFKSLINTICMTYAGSVKKDNFYAKARGYGDCLEKSLFADNVPVAVYENLIKAVDENADKLHRYIALRKKALKYDELHMYDLSVPIVDGASLSLS